MLACLALGHDAGEQTLEGADYFRSRDPQDREPALRQPVIAKFIALRAIGSIMGFPIHLDRKPGLEAGEV